MSISQQELKRIEILQLKGLRDLEMSFREKGITAILGTNGSGKSTILHALACINNPPASDNSLVNHKLSEFLLQQFILSGMTVVFMYIKNLGMDKKQLKTTKRILENKRPDGHLGMQREWSVIFPILVLGLVFQ